MKGIVLPLLMLLILASCSDYQSSANREAIAQAGNSFLYEDELPTFSNNGSTREDSISIAKNFIDRWIRKELILSKAEENLSIEYIAEIDRKLEETRENLMIYQYEQQMMLQRMDTVISHEEVQAYYDENLMNFTLSTDLIKALFIKVPVEAPNIDRARRWYRSDKQQDMQSLESFAYQFADKYDDFGEEWIDINFLLRELPETIENTSRFLRNNNYYETSDSLYHYFVNIRDFRLRGAVAPIDYAQDDIRTIILNNRKIDFLQELENGIYNEGLRDNKFRVYK